MKNSLKKWPTFVAVYPMFICVWLNLFELESGIRVECEPEPIFSRNDKISNKQAFGGTSEVQNSDYVVDFTGTYGADRSCSSSLDAIRPNTLGQI